MASKFDVIDPVAEAVKRHHESLLRELGLMAGTSDADINPIHMIRIENLMNEVTTHFVYDLKRLMKK